MNLTPEAIESVATSLTSQAYLGEYDFTQALSELRAAETELETAKSGHQEAWQTALAAAVRKRPELPEPWEWKSDEYRTPFHTAVVRGSQWLETESADPKPRHEVVAVRVYMSNNGPEFSVSRDRDVKSEVRNPPVKVVSAVLEAWDIAEQLWGKS